MHLTAESDLTRVDQGVLNVASGDAAARLYFSLLYMSRP